MEKKRIRSVFKNSPFFDALESESEIDFIFFAGGEYNCECFAEPVDGDGSNSCDTTNDSSTNGDSLGGFISVVGCCKSIMEEDGNNCYSSTKSRSFNMVVVIAVILVIPLIYLLVFLILPMVVFPLWLVANPSSAWNGMTICTLWSYNC